MNIVKLIAFSIILSLIALLFYFWFKFPVKVTEIESKALIKIDSLCVLILDSADNQRTGIGKDYIRFKKNGFIGFCDSKGKVVIQPKFSVAGPFNEGLSAAQQYGFYGYIDAYGYVDQEPLYIYTGTFRNGLSAVKTSNNSGFGFFNRKIELVIKDTFFWVDEFSEGYCIVKDSLGKFTYIDTTGRLITENYRFDIARKFKNGRALAKQGDTWYGIDRKAIITKLEKK